MSETKGRIFNPFLMSLALVTTTITYDYDPLYRLISATYSGGEVYTYTYDEVGNRLAMGVSGEATDYQYDEANRLTSAGGVGYDWDDNGNLLDDGVRTYEYDVANRLVQVISGTFTTTFTYNGDGDRVAEAVNGVTTTYVVAVLGLSQVLAETTDGETTRYVYGHDLLAEESIAWVWHLNDGLGSVRQLADSSGNVTLAQGYTPFGVPLWSEGSGVTGYGFTGERWEAYTELLFLRARYYEPTIGRFISRDTWRGELRRPSTLNLYLYGMDDPVNLLDYLGTNPHRGSIYSCNCGFIDDAHFDQGGESFAAKLIGSVRDASSGSTFPLEIPNGIPLFFPRLQVTKSTVKIKTDLTDAEQAEVALGIFQAMENASEEGWAQSLAGSSYDEEDLLSNLLSFYFALGGEYTLENIRKWCDYLSEEPSEEVSEKPSEQVFDWYKPHLRFKKVKEWGKPRLATCAEAKCGISRARHPCPEEGCPLDKYCPGERKFPSDKFNIVPEPEGDKWEFVEEP